MNKHVIVIGGGITGLSTAYHLQEEARAAGLPLTYTLIESDNRLGGKINTHYVDGFTIDGGPDCFLSRKPWAIQLSRKLGLGNELMGTNDDRRKTYVLNRGKLTPLPDGVLLVIPTRFLPFATSTLISLPGKMRMGMDLFIPPRQDESDETVANFIRRRLGQEALDKIAEPLMAGIHISDPEYQSLLGSFPRFRDIERKHGSLIRGMVSQMKSAKTSKNGADGAKDKLMQGGLRQITRLVGVPMPDSSAVASSNGKPPSKPLSMFMTMRNGLGQLVQGVVDNLKEGTLITGKQAVSLEHCDTNGDSPRYRVRTNDGEIIEGDAVIMATPAYTSADLLSGIDTTLADALYGIRYVTTTTLSMGYRLTDVGKPFGGFGFVIPRKENRQITGCTWSSTKFNHRVPENHLLLRAFIGGPGHEHLAEQNDEDLIAMVREELRSIMGLHAEPVLTRTFRWTKANPQYDVGHLDRVSDMQAHCESHPGLFITGSAFDGVGVPDCIHQGQKAAQKAVALLTQTGIANAVEA
jgi:oxygen-dependent protoporphyrinogen oxidase